MMKVSWKEYRTNKDILSMVQKERFMLSIILRNWQKSRIGHMLRGNSLWTLHWIVEWKARKRQKMMLLGWMFDKNSKWKYQNVKELAQDRDDWRCWSLGLGWRQRAIVFNVIIFITIAMQLVAHLNVWLHEWMKLIALCSEQLLVVLLVIQR